jgi:hypothetical protein
MERIGPNSVPGIHKRYLEELEVNYKTFRNDCIIYRKIMNGSDIGTFLMDMDRLGSGR